ncbi:MAG: hypothetical protein FAF03_09030 [Epsilonproteobacteria bacterium]|nr:hypothetical protein [Campylobacterota bacterium]
MQEINIWWEGPFAQEEIIDNSIDKSKYDNTAEKIGLYQVYGSHPLYGNDVLLYIGRTKGKSGFKSRLKNRWVIEYGNDANNVKIYLGTIYSDRMTIIPQEENRQIDLAEVLLINALKPAYNSSNIQSVGTQYIEKKYLVKNMNNYRNLYPILSSEYFLEDDILNVVYVDKLAKIYNAKVVSQDEFYGFDVVTNDNIFVGIDYECWNAMNVPLHIGLHKDIGEDLLRKIEKKYKQLHCKDKDEDYIYISAIDKLDEHIDENIEKIKIVIDDINELIKV